MTFLDEISAGAERIIKCMQKVIAIAALAAMAICVTVACQRVDLPVTVSASQPAHPPCHPAPSPESQDQTGGCVSACAVTQAEGKALAATALLPEAVLAPDGALVSAREIRSYRPDTAGEDRYLRLRVLRI